jgi:hypothetical protein
LISIVNKCACRMAYRGTRNQGMVSSPRHSPLPGAVAILSVTAASFVALPLLLTAAAASDESLGGVLAGAVCATTGPIDGVSNVSAENARSIAAVALARAGDHAGLITLIVGITESGLRQLANPNDPAAIGMPDQGRGTDHDSVGIFQQRPNWGTAEQRMDPVTSSNLFLDRLLTFGDWRRREPWLVAQAIQVSAYDGVPRPENNFSGEIGGNYKANLDEATRLLNIIKNDTTHLHCAGSGGSGVGKPQTGPLGPHGLPLSYAVPDNTSEAGRTAVLAALGVLGHAYQFGATGPDTFDCSGLTQWAWAKAGVQLPHYTSSNGTPAHRPTKHTSRPATSS